MHAADQPVEHTLLAARYTVTEAGLVVDRGPDAVRMFPLRNIGQCVQDRLIVGHRDT
jgi:hypothetical protein